MKKKIIQKLCTKNNEKKEIEYKFSDFIITALDKYIINLSKGEDDKSILETPYDIMMENFGIVNLQVKGKIIKSIKDFKNLQGEYSNSLLALLWFYNDNDDIICQMEESNRPIYEPMEEYYERKRKEQEERDNNDFTKKLIKNLNKMRKNKMNVIKSREIL